MPVDYEPTLSKIPSDYDLFTYGNEDDARLSLDDAIQKAAELRARSQDYFFRVIPSDRTLSSFRIEPILKETLYAQHSNRWMALLNRLLSRL